MEEAESIYHRILECSKEFLGAITGTETESHYHTTLHTLFHSTIMNLFRPFAANPVRLKTFAYGECTTRDIYTSSLDQLKRHVLVFPHRYHAAARFPWMGPQIIQTASSVLAEPLDPSCRFWFGVCMNAFSVLSRGFPMAGRMVQGFVGMATHKGVISSTEAVEIMHKSTIVNKSRKPIRGDWVVDFNLARHDRQAAGLDEVIRSTFENMNIRDPEV